MKNELNEQEAAAFRAEYAREAWEDDSIKEFQPETEQPEPEAAQEQEPEQVIPDPIQEMIAGINAKLGALDRIDYRLKQAESRIGSVQQSINTQMQAAKEATKHVTDAPSKEQIAAAAKSDEAWSNLKEEFGEWAEVLDGIEARMNAKAPKLPDVEAIRQELQTDFDKKLTVAQKKFEVRLVDIAHKDWREKSTTPEFDAWLAVQDQATRQKALSENADDVIDLLDKYDEFRKPPEKEPEPTPEEIAARRKERLARSTTPKTTGRAAHTKTEENMTPEEYRAHLAKQMWD